MMKKKLTLLGLSFLAVAKIYGQSGPDLEFFSGGASTTALGSATTTPTLSTSVTFMQNTDNPTGNTAVNYTPALTATYTISNTQYAYDVFRMGINNNTNSNLYIPLSGFSGSSDYMFTAPASSASTGISASQNYAVEFNIRVIPFNGTPATGSKYVGDLTITFNRKVNNPILNISNLGSRNSAGLGIAAKLQLTSPSATLTLLSGNSYFAVSAANEIYHTGPRYNYGSGSASGSVQVVGKNITALTFKVFIQSDSYITTNTWSSADGDDEVFEVGVSTLDEMCFKPAQTTGTPLPTKHGITALQRAGTTNGNWPMVRTGAWTALEAKTKGFVPNRLSDSDITKIPAANLKKGMMVYNTSQNCLQINTDGTAAGWKCFNNQGCPAVN